MTEEDMKHDNMMGGGDVWSLFATMIALGFACGVLVRLL